MSNIDDLGADVLSSVVAFADLPMRFTCLVASRAMRAAVSKLSPRLEHSLVLRRFPLLTTVVATSADATPPRDLYRMFASLEVNDRAQRPEPTPLDAYTMSLEIEHRKGNLGVQTRGESGPRDWQPTGERVSLYIGTGTRGTGRTGEQCAGYYFTVPAGVYERVEELMVGDGRRCDVGEWRVHATVIASRRVGGRLQFAKLFSGGVSSQEGRSYGDPNRYGPMGPGTANFEFDWNYITSDFQPGRENTRYNVVLSTLFDERITEESEVLHPYAQLGWGLEPDVSGDSSCDLTFHLVTEVGEELEMTATELAETLETLVRWSK